MFLCVPYLTQASPGHPTQVFQKLTGHPVGGDAQAHRLPGCQPLNHWRFLLPEVTNGDIKPLVSIISNTGKVYLLYMAMGNTLLIGNFSLDTPISSGCPTATFDYRRVYMIVVDIHWYLVLAYGIVVEYIMVVAYCGESGDIGGYWHCGYC